MDFLPNYNVESIGLLYHATTEAKRSNLDNFVLSDLDAVRLAGRRIVIRQDFFARWE